jgi:hypothetical protein
VTTGFWGRLLGRMLVCFAGAEVFFYRTFYLCCRVFFGGDGGAGGDSGLEGWAVGFG